MHTEHNYRLILNRVFIYLNPFSIRHALDCKVIFLPGIYIVLLPTNNKYINRRRRSMSSCMHIIHE